ncbi:hypothetical protein TeGR_g9616, partial [Tetraparma gracilis]
MSSVFLSGVSDYIDPSAACVNPLFVEPAPPAPPPSNKPSTSQKPTMKPTISLQMEVDEGPSPSPSPSPSALLPAPPKPKATLSVADCLSCSGCVTSAEAVLVESQSGPAFLDLLLASPRVALTLSPQTVTDVTRHLQAHLEARGLPPPYPSPSLCRSLLHQALKALPRCPGGSLEVLPDAPPAVHQAALHSMKEDLLYRLSAPPPSPPPPSPPHYTEASYSAPLSRSLVQLTSVATGETSTAPPSSLPPTPALPMLSSHCPGVICYVEKTIPELLPHLTRTVPAMSLTSLLLKKVDAGRKVVSVQMCHDKKLEATRKDYAGEEAGDATDLVLTTSEVWTLVKDGLLADLQAGGGEGADD